MGFTGWWVSGPHVVQSLFVFTLFFLSVPISQRLREKPSQGVVGNDKGPAEMCELNVCGRVCMLTCTLRSSCHETDKYIYVFFIFSVIRHTFWQYRRENPQTKVGEPYPDGLPGFNSGVMLLDLAAMRASSLYNQLLEPDRVAKLADQYRFRGHLGDQDFFTMIGMEHPELFYSLACGWNRQLCTWWRDHGYGDVFQLYYRCDGPVYIYHGNCNTPIPDD